MKRDIGVKMQERYDIDLSDYLRVIWKWKWFISAFSIVCTVVVGLINFSMPNIYETFMIIEPGVLGVDKDFKKFEYYDFCLHLLICVWMIQP